MGTGKLYSFDDKFIANVDCKLYNESEANWWGELVLTEQGRLEDGDGYVLEVDDGRRGRCSIQKLINRAVSTVPPRFYYRVTGHNLLR